MDPAVQEWVDVLAEKANEGLLSEPERAEYEAYINTDDFISILKLKAKRSRPSIWSRLKTHAMNG